MSAATDRGREHVPVLGIADGDPGGGLLGGRDDVAEALEASLQASGLTNKQIAERLFLSHRTVGGHLHRAFPKLGVATRAGLRDALASLSPEQLPRT